MDAIGFIYSQEERERRVHGKQQTKHTLVCSCLYNVQIEECHFDPCVLCQQRNEKGLELYKEWAFNIPFLGKSGPNTYTLRMNKLALHRY